MTGMFTYLGTHVQIAQSDLSCEDRQQLRKPGLTHIILTSI